MSNEGRYSVFPSWSSTGSSLGDDISEFDGAAQGLVVANPVGTTDELIAVRGNSCGDRPTGESSELSDWRRWREGLGHEGEADLGEADIESRIIDATPGPVDQPNPTVPHEHVAGPQVTMNEAQPFRRRWTVVVEPVDHTRERRLLGERGRDGSEVSTRSRQVMRDPIPQECLHGLIGVDTGEGTKHVGEPAWPRLQQLRYVKGESPGLDAANVGAARQPLHDQTAEAEIREVCLPEQEPWRTKSGGARGLVQTDLQPYLLGWLDETNHE